MKALATQFDDRRLSNAVATPTCSSCCCCCCCLATSIASSSLLAQRIGKEGEKHQVHNRHLLTVIAALFVPIVGMLVYLGFWTINSLLSNCTDEVYETPAYMGSNVYEVCTQPGSIAIWPLLFLVPMAVLWFLYSRVGIVKPLKRAAIVTGLIAAAFTAELFAGAAMILTGVGGIIYLILVPVIIGWISVWYHRHIGKEAVTAPAAAPLQQPNIITGQVTEQHEQPSIKPAEPPQQNPPAPSA